MIRLLNAHFVPVYTSMEDYGKKGAAPEEEKKAYTRIYHAAIKKKLSTGTVHVYVLTPEGDPIDSIHVAHAKTEKVLAVLKAAIETLGVQEGKPLVEAKPQSQSYGPKAEEGALTLHLTARSLDGRGCWGELPGEDWISYSRDEARKFLPPAGAALGAAWDVDRETALKLLHHFYPSTENNDIAKNEIEEVSMKATRTAAGQVRLDASLKMKHPFYHKKDECRVEAVAVGVVDFDESRGEVRKFRMATEKAAYNGGQFGVAVRNVP